MPLVLRALLLLLVALIPAALVQVWIEREAREARAGQVGQQAMRLVRLVASQQIRTLEGAQQVLAAMAAHRAVQALRPSEECDDFLRGVLQSYTRYTVANVFDLNGDSVCSPWPEEMRGVNVRDRWYFDEVIRTRSFVIGTYGTGRASRAPSVHLATPLFNDAGDVQAVMVLGLSVDWLVRDLLSLELPEGSSSTIADREGTILARSRDPESFVGRRMPAFAMALLNRPEPGIVDAPALDGVRRIAAYLPVHVAPEGLFITMGLEVDRVLRDAAARDRRSVALILGSLLLTFALSLAAFGAAVQRPVRRLLATARRWGRQDWNARVGPIKGGREFARLASAFDAMAAEVQAREAARAESESRLSALLDLSPQIVFTADPHGHITWINRFWHEYTGQPQGSGLGAGWAAPIHPDDRSRAGEAWMTAVARAGTSDTEFLLEKRLFHAASRTYRWQVVRARPLRDMAGVTVGWIGIAVDTHELREAQAQAEAAARRLRATYESAPAGLALLNRDLRFIAANRRLAALDGKDPGEYVGHTPEELGLALAPQIMPLLRSVVESGEAHEEVEVTLDTERGRRFLLCGFRPVYDTSPAAAAVTAAVLDITARKRAEEVERLLLREVDHRAKNALAVVRSLARLSLAERHGSAEAVVEALEGRISAMARVHTVLARERWAGAELGELVRSELEPYGDAALAEGPPIRLSSDAAQPLTMVLHEMATNAAKYGALSVETGQVLVRWRRGADRGVILTWEERAGPELSGTPPSPGFGSRLIEANVNGPLDGEADFRWEKEGLRATLRIAREATLPDHKGAG
ncbi:PAS domain-containing protein [Sabulicella rubraurantiaca]|uniref:PAS domain-containing protein n=1 Tax=Sabulicella rubraurantiaca TaxID=2811429 RepID=UPI001A957370|nr:PAS domain-containing protein [Sabulicella rubraurantiaca]